MIVYVYWKNNMYLRHASTRHMLPMGIAKGTLTIAFSREAMILFIMPINTRL